MNSTTSLKIPDSLKARVTAMAAHEGKSAHAYMVETLEEATRLKEERARLVEQADEARKAFDKDGLGYDAAEVFAHFRTKAAGKKSAKPRLRQWLE